MLLTELLKLSDFSSLILIKLITSLIYLIINYITHKLQLPVALANILRLIISGLDFVILLTLLSAYIFESCAMAYRFSILGILFSILLCAANWILLVGKDDVQSICTTNILSFVVLLILCIQFMSMGLAYKGPVAAFVAFNVIYGGCWLVIDRYPKTITNSMIHIGEKLSWVDPLIGNMSHKDLALRNVCSFSLGLLNLTYVHTSGTTISVLILFLIGLGLVINVLIGLRLIEASASVQLHSSGFIGQIIINGYNNIATIYDQLKNKHLPKATWYAWAITLTMGVTFISPCYAIEPQRIDAPEIDASLTGERQPPEEQGVSSPTGESRELLRRMSQTIQQQASKAYEVTTSAESLRFGRDVLTGVTSGGVVAGAGYVAGDMMDLEAGTNAASDKARIEELENQIREKDKTIAAQVETNKVLVEKIAKLEQKSSWAGWFKSCCKSSKDG